MPEMTSHWRVLRWEVPVDDRPHKIGAGRVLRVEIRSQRIHGPDHRVEVWTLQALLNEWPEGPEPKSRWVQVFGTGQRLPDHIRPDEWAFPKHVGSCIEPDGSLVWHVFEVDPDAAREVGGDHD